MEIVITTLGDWLHTRVKIDGKTILAQKFDFSIGPMGNIKGEYSTIVKEGKEKKIKTINFLEGIKATKEDFEKFREESYQPITERSQ